MHVDKRIGIMLRVTMHASLYLTRCLTVPLSLYESRDIIACVCVCVTMYKISVCNVVCIVVFTTACIVACICDVCLYLLC